MMTREEANVLLKMMFAFWANTHEQTNVEMEMALNLALTALRPVSREQVEKVWKGEWLHDGPKFNGGTDWYHCSRCGAKETGVYVKQNFCSYCGAPMTDEAVEMAMEKINEMEGTENGLD